MKSLLKLNTDEVVSTTTLLNPICFPEVSGDGYIDLVMWDAEDILTSVVVFISRDVEFGSLSVSDIAICGSFDLTGSEVNLDSQKLNKKTLDLIDRCDVYSTYIKELGDVMGKYEPTDYN